MRRRSAAFAPRSVARMRSVRLFRWSWKVPRRDRPQMWVNPRKQNVSGWPSPRWARRSAAKRPNAIRRVLSGGNVSANSSKRAHRVPETPGIGLVLETDHDVIRVADDHHVARGLAPSPALGPEVEHVVQVDVGQERRDHPSHDGTNLPFDLAVTIPRDCLRPHYGDGFLGAPLLLCRPSKTRWPDHGGADATAQDTSPNPQDPGEP